MSKKLERKLKKLDWKYKVETDLPKRVKILKSEMGIYRKINRMKAN